MPVLFYLTSALSRVLSSLFLMTTSTITPLPMSIHLTCAFEGLVWSFCMLPSLSAVYGRQACLTRDLHAFEFRIPHLRHASEGPRVPERSDIHRPLSHAPSIRGRRSLSFLNPNRRLWGTFALYRGLRIVSPAQKTTDQPTLVMRTGHRGLFVIA